MRASSFTPELLHLALLLLCAPLWRFSVAALPASTVARRELAVEVVHRFAVGTWVENLVYRPLCDTILATVFYPAPQLWEVDPTSGKASLVHHFADVGGLTGIAEGAVGKFYVAGGNFSFKTETSTVGSYAVWEVDLQGPSPAISHVAKFPEAGLLNGMTALNQEVMLLADSVLGAVWSCNVSSQQVQIVIQDPSMKGAGLGINGIKIWGNHLYYTNTGAATFSKIPIDLGSGKATGAAVLIASGIAGDDFIFDRKGNAWVAGDSVNELILLPQAASAANDTAAAQVVAGSVNATVLGGPSAAKFGRGGQLYLSTNGGQDQYPTMNLTLGGSISLVNVGSLE